MQKTDATRRVSLKNLWTKLRFVIILSVCYTAISFGYSFIGFAIRQPTVHFHEYTPSRFFLEVGGHFAFGVIAALPLMDISLMLLAGAMAVGIDSDHILGALNLSISGRPDHSFLYAIISAFFLVLIAKRVVPNGAVNGKKGQERDKKRGRKEIMIRKILLVPPITLLAHISFDIFAAYRIFPSVPPGGGASFPLFVPFSFQTVQFGYSAWIWFEITALVIAVVGYFWSGRVNLGHS